MVLFERKLNRVLAEVFGAQVRSPEQEVMGPEEPGPDDYIPGGGYPGPEAPGAYDVEGQVCPECGQMAAPEQRGERGWQ